MIILKHKWHPEHRKCFENLEKQNLEDLESLESLEKLENLESFENLENLETMDVRGPGPALVAPGQGSSKRLEFIKTLNPLKPLKL